MGTIRTFVTAAGLLAAAGLAFLPAVGQCSPQDKQDDAEEAVVKQLSLKGLRLAPMRGRIKKPTPIESAKQLAKVVKDKEAQAAIKKHVDFAKQHVLVFRWAGSGQDKLKATQRKGKDGKEVVVIAYSRGLTRDLRPHAYVFVINQGTKWRLEGVK